MKQKRISGPWRKRMNETYSPVSMDDFFPPRPVTMDDFYLHGADLYLNPVPNLNRRIGSDAGAVLIALAERLKDAAHAEIELLTIMEFCEILLRRNGVKFRAITELGAVDDGLPYATHEGVLRIGDHRT